MNEEKKNVISILRSLIISSPQKGKSQRDLVRDYHEVVGSKIPTFEYQTVEQFLRGSGEFVLENFRGNMIVYEKPNEESRHISKLVSEQNKKKRAPVANRFRQPVRTPNLPQRAASSYNVRSPPKTIFPRNLSNSPRSSPVHQRSDQNRQTQPNRTQPVDLGQADPLLNQFRCANAPAQPVDLRNRINQMRQNQTPIVDLTNDSDDSTIRRNNDSPVSTHVYPPMRTHNPVNLTNDSDDWTIQRNNDGPVSTHVHPPIRTFFDTSQPPPRMQDRLKNPMTKNNERKSVMDRLVNARQSLPAIDLTRRTSCYPTVQTTTPRESPVTQSTGEKQLTQYCIENGYSTPLFRLFKVHDRFQCRVTVDNILYSTYPTDYGTQNEARFETAKHALERLNSIKNQLKYEVCLDNDVELAIKIYDCIKDEYPTGIFSTKIPEKFLSLYSQLLPADWLTLIYKNQKYFTIEDCINDRIVCVVQAAELDQKMDKLRLPWEDEYWCLIITCTVSTAEIWGRLISKEHSNALDSLVVDIELELLKHKPIPKTFNVGQICLVLVHECAYRVRVEKVDDSRRKCFCFLVDDGEQRWFDMQEMFVCPAKFMKFPPQAIRFALHGLEEFDENEFAKQHLEDTLLNCPPLIGQIFTKRDDFISQEESDDLEAVIQVVLYDTSTADDINLHPIIVDKICASIPAPELVHSKLTPVIVSNIADNGDIFCQLQQNGIHYVNKLIHKIVQPSPHYHQTLPTTNSANSKLFLVFDDALNKWCRGELIREGKHENLMFLVDYGKTTTVPLSKIYRIESLSQALLSFPAQAIQVKLIGFNDFPAHLVATLRGYFSGDTTAYVNKMNIAGTIAEVSLYFVQDSSIVCVNDCLNAEIEQRHQISEIPYSRQSSTTSNSSRDQRGQDELSNFNNLTISGRKLLKFTPPDGYFDVEVIMTATPSNFHIRPMEYMQQWIDQMKSLQKYCRRDAMDMDMDMIREGESYACLHNDDSWYRAIVQNHLDTKIIVSFCDIGEIDSIDNVSKFKVLPDEYRDLPKLAVTAKLFGIRPICSDWEMDDILEFNRLVSRKKFQAIVVKIENSKQNCNDVLEIRLIDEEDECVNDIFVRSGRAIKYFSH